MRSGRWNISVLHGEDEWIILPYQSRSPPVSLHHLVALSIPPHTHPPPPLFSSSRSTHKTYVQEEMRCSSFDPLQLEKKNGAGRELCLCVSFFSPIQTHTHTHSGGGGSCCSPVRWQGSHLKSNDLHVKVNRRRTPGVFHTAAPRQSNCARGRLQGMGEVRQQSLFQTSKGYTRYTRDIGIQESLENKRPWPTLASLQCAAVWLYGARLMNDLEKILLTK